MMKFTLKDLMLVILIVALSLALALEHAKSNSKAKKYYCEGYDRAAQKYKWNLKYHARKDDGAWVMGIYKKSDMNMIMSSNEDYDYFNSLSQKDKMADSQFWEMK